MGGSRAVLQLLLVNWRAHVLHRIYKAHKQHYDTHHAPAAQEVVPRKLIKTTAGPRSTGRSRSKWEGKVWKGRSAPSAACTEQCSAALCCTWGRCALLCAWVNVSRRQMYQFLYCDVARSVNRAGQKVAVARPDAPLVMISRARHVATKKSGQLACAALAMLSRELMKGLRDVAARCSFSLLVEWPERSCPSHFRLGDRTLSNATCIHWAAQSSPIASGSLVTSTGGLWRVPLASPPLTTLHGLR